MTRWIALALVWGFLGCAPHITPLAADDLRQREPSFHPAPPGHPFSSLEQGMGIGEVRALVGKPTSLHRYATVWTYVPFYFGSGERRTVWRYSGEGRLLFADHPRSGQLELIRVEYDPEERGV